MKKSVLLATYDFGLYQAYEGLSVLMPEARVMSVFNASQAWVIFLKEQPDLVVLDEILVVGEKGLVVPEAPFFSDPYVVTFCLLRRMREREMARGLKRTTILMTTVDQPEENEQRLKEVGLAKACDGAIRIPTQDFYRVLGEALSQIPSP